MERSRVTSKKALRRQLLNHRLSLDESAFQEHSVRIMDQLAVLPELQRAQVIHCYWPILKHRELDTTTLMYPLRIRSVNICRKPLGTRGPERVMNVV